MIEQLRALFSNPAGSSDQPGNQSSQLAAAALLVEVMVADEHVDEAEQQTVADILQRLFNLEKAAIDQLFEDARQAVRQATSLYQFTRLINDHYDAAAKYQLVVNLWRVAYADAQPDKYEEGIIRRICELIYVPHSHFIRARQQVRDQL